MGRVFELGTIEAGKLADFLLLDANPLADIANTRRIYRVVKGGVMLDPQAILVRSGVRSAWPLGTQATGTCTSIPGAVCTP